jgi:hypothetical protein
MIFFNQQVAGKNIKQNGTIMQKLDLNTKYIKFVIEKAFYILKI